jgi:hypothetical protein
VTIGPDLTYNGGTPDAFVAKVNAAGTALVYCGYIGGSSGDVGFGIALDPSGNAYVAGSTLSNEATFPVTIGPDLTYNGGEGDVFVAKVNAAGNALVYCGYIGGSGYDTSSGIAVDNSGNAYISGSASSTEATFPVTIGPDLTHNGGDDAFVAKVNAAGTALVYCGYIGGVGAPDPFLGIVDEFGYGIAVDSSGSAYVTGYTFSDQATFPVTVGPDLTYNGGQDAFVARVNSAGAMLVYCGYIGGSGDERCEAIAVDSSGNAYVTGSTISSEATFPVIVGPDLTFNDGFYDAFVVKVPSTPTLPKGFYTLTPCRILDTRGADGMWGGPALSAGAIRTFTIVGRCSVPTTVNAVSINATVTQPTAPGYLVLFAGGSPLPAVSTINYRAGQTRANNAIVLLGPGGTLSVACQQTKGTTHFILDVSGYFQ